MSIKCSQVLSTNLCKSSCSNKTLKCECITFSIRDTKHWAESVSQSLFKGAICKKIWFLSQIPNLSDDAALGWRPILPTIPKRSFLTSWETQSIIKWLKNLLFWQIAPLENNYDHSRIKIWIQYHSYDYNHDDNDNNDKAIN